jgi:hypothetical protein
LKAVLLRDMDIVGRLSHEQPNSAALADRIAAFTEYFEFLRQHQLVRSDIPMHQQLYMLAAIFMGYFAVAPVMPEALGLSNQVVAELLSETIRRTFEDPPSHSVSSRIWSATGPLSKRNSPWECKTLRHDHHANFN